MDKKNMIAILENEIETFEDEHDIGTRYANDLEQGYINGLNKAIELIEEYTK